MKRFLALMGLTLTMTALAPAQESTGNRVVVPARNSTRPRLLKVTMLHANVTVKTHAGKDVIVETAAPESRRREERTSDGLRRIDLPAAGFQVEEQDNVITVHGSPLHSGNLTVTVPADTSVQLKSTNGGIVVEGVQGEIEVALSVRLVQLPFSDTAPGAFMMETFQTGKVKLQIHDANSG